MFKKLTNIRGVLFLFLSNGIVWDLDLDYFHFAPIFLLYILSLSSLLKLTH